MEKTPCRSHRLRAVRRLRSTGPARSRRPPEGQRAVRALRARLGHLNDYRDRYSLEVSSPGQDRPLTKPQHFARFLGRHARVRLRRAPASTGEPQANPLVGRKSVTGELVGASDREVTIAAGGGIVTIPYEQIARSNLIPGD